MITFDDPQLAQWLDNNPETVFDNLTFGVVKMNYDGQVTYYNKTQSGISGVAPENAKGKHFFTQVAPCTNNFMVSEKYKADKLDETLAYMFTYITQPTPVTLRLIKGNAGNQYLLAKNA